MGQLIEDSERVEVGWRRPAFLSPLNGGAEFPIFTLGSPVQTQGTGGPRSGTQPERAPCPLTLGRKESSDVQGTREILCFSFL